MRSKTPLAMMELLVMLLVFALAAAVCHANMTRTERLRRQREVLT